MSVSQDSTGGNSSSTSAVQPLSSPPLTTTSFGLVYDLAPKDEEMLDFNEGYFYIKKYLKVTLWDGRAVDDAGTPTIPHIESAGEERETLVYVDVERITEGTAREEYVYRMGMAIRDGVSKGIPQDYFDKYVRPFIPEKSQEELDAVAKPITIAYTQPAS